MNQDRPFLLKAPNLGSALAGHHVGSSGDRTRVPCFSARMPAPPPIDDSEKGKGIQIRVSFGPELSKTPLDGRLLVVLSTDTKEEPRFQISDGAKTQQIFGIDVNGLPAGPGGRDRLHGLWLSARESWPDSPWPLPGSGRFSPV